MNPKNFILGFFHNCDSDEEYTRHIEDFRQAHGGYVLMATLYTKILVFPDDGDEESLKIDWKKWVGYAHETTFFEGVREPSEWCKRWGHSFPIRLEAALVKNIS